MKKPAIAYLAAVLLLASCHSSRKAAVPPASVQPPLTQQGTGKSADEVARTGSNALVSEALAWLGTPYRYGGATREGTDCSGMVMAVYEKVAGLKLPRNSAKQQEYCRPVSPEEAAEGDLVFFTTSKNRGRVNHVGLYIGGGSFVHASTSRGVITSRLSEEYYKRHFHSIGRVPGMADAVPEAGKAPETGKVQEIEKVPAESVQDSISDIRKEVRRAMIFE